MVAEFFATARERHAIFLRRAAGQPRPWTTDPVMHEYRITNVFRELDRTTQWFRKHVRDPLRGGPEVLLATAVFRWFNRVETGEALFLQRGLFNRGKKTAFETFLESGDAGVLKFAAQAYLPRGPYCTGAYMITSPQGLDKLSGMCEVIKRFDEASRSFLSHATPLGWRDVAAQCLQLRGAGVSLEATWRWLKEFDFQGPFHAYEVVTDLRHTALLDRAPDIMTWANPGPGAQRGLNRIHGRRRAPVEGQTARRALRVPIKGEQAQREMQELLAASRRADYWPQWSDSLGRYTCDGAHGEDMSLMQSVPPEPDNWPAWEMREVEMWLCEFDKIMRVRSGDGAPRGRYER